MGIIIRLSLRSSLISQIKLIMRQVAGNGESNVVAASRALGKERENSIRLLAK